MKRNQIKIIAIILFVIQTGLAFYLFLTIRNIIGDSNYENILSGGQQLLIFVSFIVSFFISVAFIVFIMGLFNNQLKESNQSGLVTDNSTTEKAKVNKMDQQLEKDKLAKKSVILDKLSADLDKIEQLEPFAEKALINISKVYDIMQGIFFIKDLKDNVFRKKGAYAYFSEEELREFTEEVGLSGQVAANRKLLNISNIPDKYITVLSGLGKSSPANLVIFPVLYNNQSIGIIELASFIKFDAFAEEVLMDFSIMLGNFLSKQLS